MPKIPLSQQLAALDMVRGQWVNGPARKGRQAEVRYALESLDQIRVTLEWLQTHEQIIRDAISSAQSLDAAQQVP